MFIFVIHSLIILSASSSQIYRKHPEHSSQFHKAWRKNQTRKDAVKATDSVKLIHAVERTPRGHQFGDLHVPQALGRHITDLSGSSIACVVVAGFAARSAQVKHCRVQVLLQVTVMKVRAVVMPG